MSVKVRRFALNTLASASAASRRSVPSASCSLLRVGSSVSSSPRTSKRSDGDGLVEKAVPGGASGDRLLVEQLLDLVLELERLVLADVLEPGPVAGERLRLHRRVEHRIVDAVELEGEEQELARGRGQPLLRVAVELGPLRIGGVARIDEAGIGHDPAEEVLDRLVAQHGGAERVCGVLASGEPVELAAVGLGEGLALGLGPGEVAREIRAVHGRVEVGEVPFGQGAELGWPGAGPQRRLGRAQVWVEA